MKLCACQFFEHNSVVISNSIVKLWHLPWQSDGPSIIHNDGLVKVVIEKGPRNATLNVNGFVILTLLTPREAMIGVVFFDKLQIHFTCEKVIEIIRCGLIGTAVIHRQEYSWHCHFVLLLFLREHNTIGRFRKLSATMDETQRDNGIVSFFCICTSVKISSNSHLQ